MFLCLSVQLPEDASIHDFVIELVEETKKFEESKKVGKNRRCCYGNIIVTALTVSYLLITANK